MCVCVYSKIVCVCVGGLCVHVCVCLVRLYVWEDCVCMCVSSKIECHWVWEDCMYVFGRIVSVYKSSFLEGKLLSAYYCVFIECVRVSMCIDCKR